MLTSAALAAVMISGVAGGSQRGARWRENSRATRTGWSAATTPRACVAIGMTPEDSSLSGYLHIARDGAAAMRRRWRASSSTRLTTPRPRLRSRWSACRSMPTRRAVFRPARCRSARPAISSSSGLAPEALPDLLAAMRSATKITLDLYDSNRKLSSLSRLARRRLGGAPADGRPAEARIDAVTALSKPGTAAASTIPPVPALHRNSFRCRSPRWPIRCPSRRRPLAKPMPDGCGDGPAFMSRSSCPAELPALGHLRPRPAPIISPMISACSSAASPAVPGTPSYPARSAAATATTSSWLWNAYVDDDTNRLNTYFKGRGLGDCGGAPPNGPSTGRISLALTYIAMGDCRGVMQDDWPCALPGGGGGDPPARASPLHRTPPPLRRAATTGTGRRG